MGRVALLKLVEKSELMVSRFTLATGGGAGDSAVGWGALKATKA